MNNRFLLIAVAFCALILCGTSKKAQEKPAWAKKDIRDYSDADMERLLDQWEEDEEPLEPDELPEYLRPAPQVDINKIKDSGPEELLKMTKKGRTLMTFVTVSGEPDRETTEEVTKLWQTSLWNNHIQAERYVIDDNRAIFMFKDGSQAWEAKDYIVDQPECKEVSIENKIYPGKYSEKDEENFKKKKPPSTKATDEL